MRLPPAVIRDLQTCFVTYLDAVEIAGKHPLRCVGAWLPSGARPHNEHALQFDTPTLPEWARTPYGLRALQAAADSRGDAPLDLTGRVQVWREGPSIAGLIPLVPLAWTIQSEEQADDLRVALRLLGEDLQAWSDRYNITTPWVLNWAIKSIVLDANDERANDDRYDLGVQVETWLPLADSVRNAINGETDGFDLLPLPDPLRETWEQVEARYRDSARQAWQRRIAEASRRGYVSAKRRAADTDAGRHVDWIIKYYCDGCSQSEVAQLAGVSEQAVGKALRQTAALLDLPPRRAKRSSGGMRNKPAAKRVPHR
jgi:hypothetical protein